MNRFSPKFDILVSKMFSVSRRFPKLLICLEYQPCIETFSSRLLEVLSRIENFQKLSIKIEYCWDVFSRIKELPETFESFKMEDIAMKLFERHFRIF